MRDSFSNASLWGCAMLERTADRLIVAFNFPPFTDGSAVTVAKRIIEAAVPVDVIAADLSSVRARDESLIDLVAPWLIEHYTVKVPVLFADERSLVPFVERDSGPSGGDADCPTKRSTRDRCGRIRTSSQHGFVRKETLTAGSLNSRTPFSGMSTRRPAPRVRCPSPGRTFVCSAL